MTDKYEQFKKWFTHKQFKAKKDHTWYDPEVLFFEFEQDLQETNTITNLQKICNKYKIQFYDLPEVLEEYITYDNAEYLEKLQERTK